LGVHTSLKHRLAGYGTAQGGLGAHIRGLAAAGAQSWPLRAVKQYGRKSRIVQKRLGTKLMPNKFAPKQYIIY
jgi:hypothetical protein